MLMMMMMMMIENIKIKLTLQLQWILYQKSNKKDNLLILSFVYYFSDDDNDEFRSLDQRPTIGRMERRAASTGAIYPATAVAIYAPRHLCMANVFTYLHGCGPEPDSLTVTPTSIRLTHHLGNAVSDALTLPTRRHTAPKMLLLCPGGTNEP